MTRKIAPSEQKAQEIAQWLHRQRERSDGQELVSALVRLATERVLQEALEHEQAETLSMCGRRISWSAPLKRNGAGRR
jgi:hypothetical protein